FVLPGARRNDKRVPIPRRGTMGVIRVSSRFQILWNSCGGVRSSTKRIYDRPLVGVLPAEQTGQAARGLALRLLEHKENYRGLTRISSSFQPQGFCCPDCPSRQYFLPARKFRPVYRAGQRERPP